MTVTLLTTGRVRHLRRGLAPGLLEQVLFAPVLVGLGTSDVDVDRGAARHNLLRHVLECPLSGDGEDPGCGDR